MSPGFSSPVQHQSSFTEPAHSSQNGIASQFSGSSHHYVLQHTDIYNSDILRLGYFTDILEIYLRSIRPMEASNWSKIVPRLLYIVAWKCRCGGDLQQFSQCSVSGAFYVSWYDRYLNHISISQPLQSSHPMVLIESTPSQWVMMWWGKPIFWPPFYFGPLWG